MIKKPDYDFIVGCIVLCTLCYFILTAGGE